MFETIPVEYIPVVAEDVPCSFRIKLGDKTFHLSFEYNDVEDFFTVTLANTRGEVMYTRWPIHYGTRLFDQVRTGDFPSPIILPFCLDEQTPERITYENFGREVKLYLLDRPGYVEGNPSNPGYGF